MLSSAGIFPLSLVLDGVEYAGDNTGAWRPDWPLELPPDAFKTSDGEISRVTIEGDGISLIFGYDAEGRLEEFPFMLNGTMAQVGIVYGDESEIREMELTFPAEEPANGDAAREAPDSGEAAGSEPWKLEFLQYLDTSPVLVRACRGDAWYFIYLTRGGNWISETWYDAEGNFLDAYSFSLTEIGERRRIRELRDYSADGSDWEFYYDSRGFLTETSGPGGVYKVLYYREDLPRYWEYPSRKDILGTADGAVNYSLQWDESDFLVRVTGQSSPGMDEENLSDCRYEYTLDERGNWIERREIQMKRRVRLLVPAPGTTFTRVLEYRPQE